MRESDIQLLIRLALAKIGSVMFRQNVGMGWSGHEVERRGGSVLVHGARPLHAGLCEGSSDLIGWTPVEITQDMVGKTIAVFTAVECKRPGARATRAQENFLRQLRSAGGIGIVARSEGEALGGISAWRAGTQ